MTSVKTCAICGKEYLVEEMHETVDGSYICDTCYEDNNYYTCEICGFAFCNDEEGAWIERENIEVCGSCLDEYYTTCNDCGEYVRIEDAYNTAYGETVCSKCYEDHYFTCVECGQIYHMDNCIYDEDTSEYLCANCYTDREAERNNNTILPYHDGHPDGLHFYGNGPLYFGCEIEIDEGGEDGEKAEIIRDTLGYDYCHIEHDGSLRDGFEIITQPMSYKFYEENIRPAMIDTFSTARRLGYCSHDSGTCGLHIHVSRNALSEEAIFILHRLMYQFKDEFMTFSRRNRDQLHYCELPKTLYPVSAKPSENRDRYQALNLTNRETVEFRLWNGTLNSLTFDATLEFTLKLCEWANTHTIKDVNNITWDDLINDLLPGTNYLRDYLVKRSLYYPEVHEAMNVTIGEYLIAAD